jgi:hypothetical protein
MMNISLSSFVISQNCDCDSANNSSTCAFTPLNAHLKNMKLYVHRVLNQVD